MVAKRKDGYILTLFRIPGKKGERGDVRKKVPLVVQPGILCDSDNLLAPGPPYAPTFFFVDKGYDVWVPNSRGTAYSRTHTRLSPNDKVYWNFTFHEMALYDQVAYLNYITKVTGHSKVHFLGHSQGATQMFAGMTIDPEFYAGKIRSFISMGGVTQMDKTRSTFLRLLHKVRFMEISEMFGLYEFGGYNRDFGLIFAGITSLLPSITPFIASLMSDDYFTGLNDTRARVFMARYPQGGSTKSMKHLFQLMDHPGFFRYRERSTDPFVSYDLSKIPAVPIAVIGGAGDLMSSTESQLWLHEELIKFEKKHYMRIYPVVGHIGLIAPNDNYPHHLFDIDAFFKSAETDFFSA